MLPVATEALVDRLLPEVMAVLGNIPGEYHFASKGVRVILDAWYGAKFPLIEFLSRHPDWSWDDLAVTFGVVDEHDLSSDDIRERFSPVIDIVRFCRNVDLRIFDKLRDHAHVICGNATATLTDHLAYSFQLDFSGTGKKFREGQKVTRALTSVFAHYGVDKEPGFDRAFAMLCDTFRAVKRNMFATLSVHPCDFIRMADPSNGWKSCHSYNGEYASGPYSYMCDRPSMILSVMDDPPQRPLWRNKKRDRMMFHFSPEGALLQSRLYPNYLGSAAEMKRGLYLSKVQRIFKTIDPSLDKWRQVDAGKLFSTHQHATHFRDYDQYERFKTREFILDRRTPDDISETETLIGTAPRCLICGCELINEANSDTLCGDCHDSLDDDPDDVTDDDPYDVTDDDQLF